MVKVMNGSFGLFDSWMVLHSGWIGQMKQHFHLHRKPVEFVSRRAADRRARGRRLADGLPTLAQTIADARAANAKRAESAVNSAVREALSLSGDSATLDRSLFGSAR